MYCFYTSSLSPRQMSLGRNPEEHDAKGAQQVNQLFAAESSHSGLMTTQCNGTSSKSLQDPPSDFVGTLQTLLLLRAHHVV